ncbi:MAG: hypothetical protein HUK40_04080 [Desulfobacter sp.]|nr:hypothetical protein [Desulfobacter sp.]WDP85059.1 MAG: hypothetical protein HUN05_07835 [Desulfobacter sp.]
MEKMFGLFLGQDGAKELHTKQKTIDKELYLFSVTEFVSQRGLHPALPPQSLFFIRNTLLTASATIDGCCSSACLMRPLIPFNPH